MRLCRFLGQPSESWSIECEMLYSLFLSSLSLFFYLEKSKLRPFCQRFHYHRVFKWVYSRDSLYSHTQRSLRLLKQRKQTCAFSLPVSKKRKRKKRSLNERKFSRCITSYSSNGSRLIIFAAGFYSGNHVCGFFHYD